jgi:hypothetical protein
VLNLLADLRSELMAEKKAKEKLATDPKNRQTLQKLCRLTGRENSVYALRDILVAGEKKEVSLFVSLSFCFLLTCCFLLKCRWL